MFLVPCFVDSCPQTINFNTNGDCVFRACADPAHPTLTPTDGYRVYATTSPKGEWMDHVLQCGVSLILHQISSPGGLTPIRLHV